MEDTLFTKAVVPDHIPPELIGDYPLQRGRVSMERPHDIIQRIQDTEKRAGWFVPGLFGDRGGWVFRAIKDNRAIGIDTDHFSNAAASPFGEMTGGSWRQLPNEYEIVRIKWRFIFSSETGGQLTRHRGTWEASVKTGDNWFDRSSLRDERGKRRALCPVATSRTTQQKGRLLKPRSLLHRSCVSPWSQQSRRNDMADLSGIKEHMEVIGADGVHVGTVDHVDGHRIKLTKADSGAHGDHHHYVSGGLVAAVEGDKVRLSASAASAVQLEEEKDGHAVADRG